MSNQERLMKVVVTGSAGLLGYHLRAAVASQNCSRTHKGQPEKYELQQAPRLDGTNSRALQKMLASADAVIHLAGVNRADPEVVEKANIEMAIELVSALVSSNSKAHLIYTNTTHCFSDTHYGRGKQGANLAFDAWAIQSCCRYANVILPHVFGENAKPFYNNVTATLCHQVAHDETPVIHDGASVELVHATHVVDEILSMANEKSVGTQVISGKSMSVDNLYELLLTFRDGEKDNVYPDLSSGFSLALYNCYRWFSFPQNFPKFPTINTDERGILFEAVKGGGGGQTFLSWTKPGVERGNHFHRYKVERFLVLSGQADIKIRKLFDEPVQTISVSGEEPVFVDMLTLHTHSIVNTGKEPLLTLFWAHELFDPTNPDTFALSVDVGNREDAR